jgi:hypothetical protein
MYLPGGGILPKATIASLGSSRNVALYPRRVLPNAFTVAASTNSCFHDFTANST